MKAIRRVIEASAGIALILYPIGVYFCLTRFGPRVSAALLLVLLLPVVILRARRLTKGVVASVTFVPLLATLILVAALVLNREGLVLFVPVAINGLLALAFGWSVGSKPPMIERFARLIDPDLTKEEVRWCRFWTVIWTGYFVCNGSVTLLLALWAPLGWWTTYTGLIAYVLMGCLFGVEYSVRKFRFGRFRAHLLDRALQSAFSAIRRRQ